MADRTEYQRQYYQDNKFKVRDRNNASRQVLRDKCRAYLHALKRATPCLDCDTFYPAVCMDFHHWGEKIKEVLGCDTGVQSELDAFFAAAEREVIGRQTKARSKGSKIALPTLGAETVYETWDVTTASSDTAKIWEGYGTALKPAWEPIVVGRKP